MRFQLSNLAAFGLVFASISSTLVAGANLAKDQPKYVRIDKNDVALLVVDHQIGLFHLVRDFPPDQFRSNVLAHATLAKIFNLPTILTTSADTGPNGPLPRELIDLHPSAPVIRRQGEVNAWDSKAFRDAVYATNKTQIIIGGVTTDVCTAFLALSLVEEGFTVFANSEASGTFDQRIAEEANERMRKGGVQVLSMFAIFGELMRDWRSTPGSKELLPFFDKYMAAYSNLARGHLWNIRNGTVIPGQELLPM